MVEGCRKWWKKILCIVDAKRWVCSAFRIVDTWMTNTSQPFLPTEAVASQSTGRSRANEGIWKLSADLETHDLKTSRDF
jgi:hypothetical protein